jgi:hypothetical protein
MTFPMPVGSPVLVFGRVTLSGFFGFLTAKVEVPEGLNEPFLPMRLDNSTVFAGGSFSGM